jgi:AraC-like DNA-binding protein
VFEYNSAVTSVFSYDFRLRRVANFVESHFSEVIRLEQVASAAGLEVTYFSKYFRRQVGLNFRDWLAAYRIEKACQLMREQKHSITHVASLSGFGDARNFERATMKYAGCTPKYLRAYLRPKLPPAISSKLCLF